MQNRGGIAAIAWSPIQRHVADYARRLNASLYNIHYLRLQRPLLAPIKYIPQCLKTWLVLIRQRPSAVYVFISPVFAALSVYIYCWFAGVPFIMDIGGHAIISRKWAWSAPLLRFLAGRAGVNIVDHEGFKSLLDSWDVKSVLLERPPFAKGAKLADSEAEKPVFAVTLISTFASDEPIEIVLNAAEQLSEMSFFVLGDTGLAPKSLLANSPSNVTFTGYLSGDDYWELLNSSQVLMVLTTASNSLLSGAVEGMAVGKPLILSKQPVLTDYFNKGTVFVDHSVESIIFGVRAVREQEDRYTREIKELAVEKQERWESEFQKIWTSIGIEPSVSESLRTMN